MGRLFRWYVELQIARRTWWFVVAARLRARLKHSHLEISVGRDFSVGRGVRLDLGGKRNLVRIGDRVTLADGVLLNLVDAEVTLGEGVGIKRECILNVFGGKLAFTKMCGLSQRSIVHCAEEVTIGSYTVFSEYVTIVDSAHVVPQVPGEVNWLRDGTVEKAPVRIGSHVFVGAKATILMGVTVGDHSIVAANSLVARDVPPHSTAIGVPARVTRRPETPGATG